MQNQSPKATKITCCLNDKEWGNKSPWLDTKGRMYKPKFIWLVFTYIAETRGDGIRTIYILETTELSALQKNVGKTMRHSLIWGCQRNMRYSTCGKVGGEKRIGVGLPYWWWLHRE